VGLPLAVPLTLSAGERLSPRPTPNFPYGQLGGPRLVGHRITNDVISPISFTARSSASSGPSANAPIPVIVSLWFRHLHVRFSRTRTAQKAGASCAGSFTSCLLCFKCNVSFAELPGLSLLSGVGRTRKGTSQTRADHVPSLHTSLGTGDS